MATPSDQPVKVPKAADGKEREMTSHDLITTDQPQKGHVEGESRQYPTSSDTGPVKGKLKPESPVHPTRLAETNPSGDQFKAVKRQRLTPLSGQMGQIKGQLEVVSSDRTTKPPRSTAVAARLGKLNVLSLNTFRYL